MRMTLWIGALATIGALYAQNISGDWQETLKAGPREFRLIMKIEKGANGAGASPSPVKQTNNRRGLL